MKLKCLFGHDWQKLPWFKPRDDNAWSNPEKICMRCFKTWRPHYFLVVRTIEGRGWRYYLPPHWEGQSVPEGYDSWKEYHERIDGAVRRLTNEDLG